MISYRGSLDKILSNELCYTRLEPKKQVKATKDLIKKKLELIESLKDT